MHMGGIKFNKLFKDQSSLVILAKLAVTQTQSIQNVFIRRVCVIKRTEQWKGFIKIATVQ